MTTELLVRMLHFLGIVGLTAALAVQNALLRPALTPRELRRLAAVDALYGLSALLVFGAGHALWFFVGKPKDFYTGNPVFHVKLTIFVVIFLLSLVSTVFLLRNRRTASETVAVPARVRALKRTELGLLLAMPVLGVLIARGVGLA